MYFNRTKALTELMSLTMAAAIAGAPVNAMGMTVHSEKKLRGIRSSYSVTPGNAQAELVSNALDSMARTGSERFFSSASRRNWQDIVGRTFISAGKTEFAVASPNVYLNIHADASLGSEIVGRMYSNSVAKILRNDGSGWSKVESGKVVGYVLSEYLIEGDEAQMITELVGTRTSSDNESSEDTENSGDIPDDNNIKESAGGRKKTESVVYPVAESSEEIEERRENGTVVDAADEAQKKADEAAEVADEARKMADDAREQTAGKADVSGEEDTAVSEEDTDRAETAEAVAQITQKAADAAQKSADEAREDMRSHGAESGEAVAQFALKYVGNPYVWGGSSLTNGTDCSGFTMAVYANFGVSLPHYDASQRSYGIAIGSLDDARAGDLICYYGHVGIYIGDGMIVHAANARDGIKVSRADYRQIAAIRRIFY